MKFDHYGCLIREKYNPEFHYGNLGDSCAETSRLKILGYRHGDLNAFYNDKGFLRHPLLANVPGWDHRDFSNDQFLALLMAKRLEGEGLKTRGVFIPGTRTLISVGVFCMIWELFWLLNVTNVIQGWLLNLSFRWSDDGRVEKSAGQVQDWLNYICIFVFLREMGRPATLNQPIEKCLAAVHKYYLNGHDAEPNGDWIAAQYEKALTGFYPQIN